MPSTIALLDEATINLIAAGEVVEGPSSIVKELVENSLDAGAKRIFIALSRGGHDRIVVEDDGCGMSEEDVRLSVARHATSKIRAASDLYSLTTFGFRGEALAAIAATSKCTIQTRGKKAQEPIVGPGVVLSIEGGKNDSCHPAQCRQGTHIEIADLFYNTPARRKFLKNPSRCAFEVTRTITAIALAHPAIAFEYINDDAVVINVEAETQEQRLAHLLGEAYAQDVRYTEATSGGYAVRGFFAMPEKARLNRTGQYIFVADRPIYSPLISGVIKEAYGTTIDKERHPQFVLFLTFDNGECDVNVHPQKKEVRFSQEDKLKELLYIAIQQILYQRPAAQRVESPICQPFAEAHERPVPALARENPHFQVHATSFEQPIPTAAHYEEQKIPLFACSVVGIFQKYAFALISWGDKQVPPPLLQEGLVVIDMEALSRRLTFDKLQKREGKASAQFLLTPIFMEFAPFEMERLKTRIPSLEALGFDVRLFSATSILIEAIPDVVNSADVPTVMRHAIEEEELFVQQCVLSASYGAASRLLSKEEVTSGITQLMELPEWLFCPKGKPIFAPLTKKELEDKF